MAGRCHHTQSTRKCPCARACGAAGGAMVQGAAASASVEVLTC